MTLYERLTKALAGLRAAEERLRTAPERASAECASDLPSLTLARESGWLCAEVRDVAIDLQGLADQLEAMALLETARHDNPQPHQDWLTALQEKRTREAHLEAAVKVGHEAHERANRMERELEVVQAKLNATLEANPCFVLVREARGEKP